MERQYEKVRFFFISIVMLWLGVANAQTEKQLKRINKTFKKSGYDVVHIVKIKKDWFSFERSELDATLKRNFPNSNTIRIFDKNYHVVEPKGKWVWYVTYKENDMSGIRIRVFNKSLKRIIR